MGCSYKYKGKEYTSRKELLLDVTRAEVQSKSSPNKMVYEVNGLAGMAEAKLKATDKYDTDEFLTFTRQGDKIFMSIDERLFNEIAGNKRLVYNDNKQLVEVDIDEMVRKFNSGKLNPNPSLYDAIQLRLADSILRDAKEELSTRTEQPKENLMNLLNSFAQKMGITVQKMGDYQANYAERNGTPSNVSALADMFNKIIALSNEGNLEDFTEEIAHFAIEYYKNQEVLTPLLNKIDQTNTYKRYAAQYRQAYSKDYSGEALENKVRTEVLGKLLAENILNNYNTENAGLNETGIINIIKDLFNQFLDLFRKTDANKAYFKEFGKVLDGITNDLSNDSGFSKFSPVESKEVFYSLTQEEQTVSQSLKNILGELKNKYSAYHKDSSSSKRNRNFVLGEMADNITNAYHLDAILNALGALRSDMNDAFNTIKGAERAVDEMLAKKKILEGDNYVEPETKELNQYLIDAIGEVNLPNLMIAVKSIDQFISELSSNVDYINENTKNSDLVKKEQIAIIKKSLASLNKRKSEILPEINRVTRILASNYIKNIYLAKGVTEEQADKYQAQFISNTMEDVNIVSKFLMGYGSYGDPVTKAIYAYIRKAEALKNIRRRSFINRFVNKAQELGITKEDADKLVVDGFMLEDIDRRKAEIAMNKEYEALQASKIAELELITNNTPNAVAERLAIQNKYQEDAYKLMKKWRVLEYSSDFGELMRNRSNGNLNPVTNSPYRSQKAQDLISSLSRDTRSILAKYKDQNKNKVSAADKIRLQGIASDRSHAMSLYDNSGQLKSNDALALAYDLQDFYNSGNKQISQKAIDKFNVEKAIARNNNEPGYYESWLESNSYRKYSEEDLPLGTMKRDVDKQAMDLYFENNPNKLKDIQSSVFIPNLIGEPTYQQLYDALKLKQEQLIKPYRKAGDSTEIDGAAVESDSDLLNALDEVNSQMALFRFQENQGKNFIKSSNKSFKAQYDKLKKESPRALSDWLRINAEEDKINGGYKMAEKYPVPIYRHYSKWELVDEAGKKVEKEIVPTMYWEMQVADKEVPNPEFDQFLKGKAIQFNKEIKAKFKNQTYFDTFSPDVNGKPTKNLKLYEFRNYVLNQKAELDRPISKVVNSYFMLPQVRPYTAEALTSKGKLKSKIKDAFVTDNYSEDFNMDSTGFGRKSESTFIPVHYIKMMDDPAQLSNDLGYMMAVYADMAYNYQEKSKVLVRVEVLKNALMEATIKEKGKGSGANIFKGTEEFISANLYGNKYVEIDSLSRDLGEGKKFSATKTINSIYSWQVIKNLGLSIYVPVVGGFSASVSRKVMEGEGTYFTKVGNSRAEKDMKYGLDLLKLSQDIGAVRPTSYWGKFAYFSGVTGVENEYSKGIFASNKLERMTKQLDPFFAHYQVIGTAVAIKTARAVYDNFRLINGEFITFRHFEEAEVSKNSSISRKEIFEKWKAYEKNSFLDYIKEGKNEIEIDYDKLEAAGFDINGVNDLKARIDEAAKIANELVEGAAQGVDKALAARNPILQLLFLMHRSFFQRFVERGFKTRQLNTTIGVEEEGTYTTFRNVFKKSITNLSLKEMMIMLTGYFKASSYHDQVMTKLGLDSLEKLNTHRIRKDMHVYAGAFAAYVLLNLLADDDDNEDDFVIQYAAYVASRVFNETGSVQLPFGVQDTLNMFQSPSSGYGFIKDLANIPGLMMDATDTVKSGAYEGWYKGFKLGAKYTPLKNVIEPMRGNPRKSNMFFRQNTIGSMPEAIYQSISDGYYDK